MQTREAKALEIKEISERFGKAKAAFLVDFKGLDVEKVTKLRKLLRPINSEFRVVKNTLAIRALKEHASFEAPLKDALTGNNAVVFAYEDASAPAKALSAFVKENEAVVMKSGAMDGKMLNEAQIKYLATLPGKPELRAKLLGTLQAPSQRFVSVLNAAPSAFVRLLAAYRDQKQAAGG
jgi:large subunit ribosomal protein L10